MRDDTNAALLALADADADTFGAVAEVYRLPRATEPDKATRSASMRAEIAR